MIQRNVILPRAARPLARIASASTLGLCVALLGCSDDSINMGEGIPVVEEEPGLPSSSRCADSPVLEGDVLVRNQDELDALEGCEVIRGNLGIVPFEGAHLRTLHALTEVSGVLGIGDASGILQLLPGEEPSDITEADFALAALAEAWLPSLEGLEALERAGGLQLNGLTAEHLRPLARLQTLTNGYLTIWSAPNLRSFDGLQSLVGLERLEVVGVRALESFDGLSLPKYMRELSIENADLRQLEPLGVEYVEWLRLFDNRLTTLDAFASLTSAGHISLISNRRLVSLMGLKDLTQLDSLVVEYNIRITEVPDFEQLLWLRTLRFVVSPLLSKLPSFPALFSGAGLPREAGVAFEESLGRRPDVVQVYGMDALTTLTLPGGWSSASLVEIELNPNLRQIEFTNQSYIEFLSILRNPVLESVTIGALDKVSMLNLAENPLLPATSFDAVRRLDTLSDPGSGAP